MGSDCLVTFSQPFFEDAGLSKEEILMCMLIYLGSMATLSTNQIQLQSQSYLCGGPVQTQLEKLVKMMYNITVLYMVDHMTM